MAEIEIWLPVTVEGLESFYSVSSLGRVRSEAREVKRQSRAGKGYHTYHVPGKILSISHNHDGYPVVNLCSNGVCSTHYVHDLLTSAFLGPKPEGHQVRHLDDNKANTRLSNLSYGTPSANGFDAVSNGRNFNASKTECKHGHLFAVHGIRLPSNPRIRVCRMCRIERERRYREKKRLKGAA